MLSASRQGYLPIGIDLKLGALKAARSIMLAHDVEGYVVGADLKQLPFKSSTFNAIFSYSVIQHTHRQRASACVEEIHRVLRGSGFCVLEFPMKYGLGNLLGGTSRSKDEENDYDSTCVRYYSIRELQALFNTVFGNFTYRPDCYMGIGVQRSDIDILPWRYKPVVVISETLKGFARFLPLLRDMADSLYVHANKNVGADSCDRADSLSRFEASCDNFKGSNRPVVDLLECPVTGGNLKFDTERQELISDEARLAYPVIGGIPFMVVDRARKL